MLKERLQILIDTEQRRRLDLEAARRGISIGAVVREAIDARLSGPGRERKRQAVEEMRAAPAASFRSPEELSRMIAAAIDDASDLAASAGDPAG